MTAAFTARVAAVTASACVISMAYARLFRSYARVGARTVDGAGSTGFTCDSRVSSVREHEFPVRGRLRQKNAGIRENSITPTRFGAAPYAARTRP